LSLGYALVDTWLAAIGPVGGVFLVSWFASCCAALLVLALQGDAVCRFLAACLVVVIFVASGYLSGLSWVEPSGSAVSYRLLQINEPQHRKFDAPHAQEQVQRTAELIERKRADLIVTPETAFPQFLNQLPQGVLARLRAFSLRTQSHLMLGIPTTAANSDGHNSVLHLAPPGPDKEDSISQYHKIRLMPFGEYSPWGFGWFTRHLAIPLKDLSAGAQGQSPFRVGPQQAGILICDEDGLGDDARRWVGGEGAATILINPSNLAWFEGSLAIEQRLQMARMRAIEVGRPILRVANTGVTAHIDRQGTVVNRLPADTEGELIGEIQGSSGLTPYAKNGSVPFLSTLALSLLVSAFYLSNRQRY
jgi:apolipoprotein N-acyltransferase